MLAQPPEILDGARVLAVALLNDSRPTGGTLHTVNGEVVVTPAALAIAQYDGEKGVYLFYCDPHWNVVTDTFHDSIDAAIAQARWEYTNVAFTSTGGHA